MHCQGPNTVFKRGTAITRIESKEGCKRSEQKPSVESEVGVTYGRSNDRVHREVPETDARKKERGRVTPLYPPPQGAPRRVDHSRIRRSRKHEESHIRQSKRELVRSGRQKAYGRTGERHMTLVPDALRVCHDALTIRPVMD